LARIPGRDHHDDVAGADLGQVKAPVSLVAAVDAAWS
jgi:hypothetical protein